jgi:hypothetical protein
MIEYELRSKPGCTVSIPEESAEKAEELMKALNSVETFRKAIAEEPAFGNPGIVARSTELIKTTPQTADYLRLQDIIYLRLCINLTEQKGAPESFEVTGNLIGVVETLEQGRELEGSYLNEHVN